MQISEYNYPKIIDECGGTLTIELNKFDKKRIDIVNDARDVRSDSDYFCLAIFVPNVINAIQYFGNNGLTKQVIEKGIEHGYIQRIHNK